MKKILLSIASVALCIPSLFATDYTLTMKGSSYSYDTGESGTLGTTTISQPKNSKVLTVKADDFTLTCDRAEGGTTPAYNKAEDLRCYGKNTITITPPAGETITSVEFVISTQGKSQQGKITADTGTVAAQTKGGESVSWSGGAAAVTFTVGADNDHGTNASKTAGQLCFTAVKVTTESGASAKNQPNLKFDPETITVKFGDEFTSPVFTADVATDLVTFTSTDDAVATYSVAEGLKINAVGEATITAEFAGNDDFYKGAAELAVTVTDPNVVLDSPLGEGFTFENPENLKVWKIDTRYGLKGSAYLSGKVNEATAYAVSPVIDLTGKKSAVLNFKNMFNNYKLNNTMIDVADFSGYAFVSVREEGAETWADLENAITAPTAFSFDFYDNDPVDLTAYAGKKIQIAFKYVSTAEVAGTWKVQAIIIKGEPKDPVVAPAVPVVKVAGETPEGNVEFTKGESVEVAFDQVEGVEIYYHFQASETNEAILRAEGDYTLYTEPFTISETGVLAYYAKNEGGESAVSTINFIAKAEEPGQTLPDGIEITPAPGKVTAFPDKITVTFKDETDYVFINGGSLTITTPSGSTVNVAAPSSMTMTAPFYTVFTVPASALPSLTAEGKYDVDIPTSIFYFMSPKHDYPQHITFYYTLDTGSAVEGVEAAENTVYNVYDLNGRIVRRNAADLNGLDKGVYIVNGEKVLVK